MKKGKMPLAQPSPSLPPSSSKSHGVHALWGWISSGDSRVTHLKTARRWTQTHGNISVHSLLIYLVVQTEALTTGQELLKQLALRSQTENTVHLLNKTITSSHSGADTDKARLHSSLLTGGLWLFYRHQLMNLTFTGESGAAPVNVVANWVPTSDFHSETIARQNTSSASYFKTF